MEETEETTSINSLPNEILLLILQQCNCSDICNFSLTNKHFYETVMKDTILWRKQSKYVIPRKVYKRFETQENVDWLKEIKEFNKLKNDVYSELTKMSPKFYCSRTFDSPTVADCEIFFHIALANEVSYYYTTHVLQDIAIKGHRYVNQCKAIKNYTLTDIFYAKVVLKHLLHGFLAVKWVQARLYQQLTPEVVVDFFVQWSDPCVTRSHAAIEHKINDVVSMILSNLTKNSKVKSISGSIEEKLKNRNIPEETILDAINHCLYNELRIAVVPSVTPNTLDILRMLNDKCGGHVAVAAIYQAVARKLGVTCEVVVFRDHFFLVYISNSGTQQLRYKINLRNGLREPMRSCPYAQSSNRLTYDPDQLVHYIICYFLAASSEYRTWSSQNAECLKDFLIGGENNGYQRMLPTIINHVVGTRGINVPMNLECLIEDHRNQLCQIFVTFKIDETTKKREQFTVKPHDSRVKFAVGMMVHHRRYRYVGVVRSWLTHAPPPPLADHELRDLRLGAAQPFYVLTAVDQTDRYAAQENLELVPRPHRLLHLEDTVAREFSHFDGFSYVPNAQKREEYPTDHLVAEDYRNRYMASDPAAAGASWPLPPRSSIATPNM